MYGQLVSSSTAVQTNAFAQSGFSPYSIPDRLYKYENGKSEIAKLISPSPKHISVTSNMFILFAAAHFSEKSYQKHRKTQELSKKEIDGSLFYDLFLHTFSHQEKILRRAWTI